MKGNYKEAIELYTKAIEKAPNVAVYYTNRALCFMKLSQWISVVDDCRHALEIESRSVKANFYIGQALLELNNFDDAIMYLKKSFDLSKELNENYGDEITRSIRNAKRKRWNCLEEKRIQQEILLQSYLNRLIIEDKHRRINQIKQNRAILNEDNDKHDSVSNNDIDAINEKNTELHASSSFASVSTSPQPALEKARSFDEGNINRLNDDQIERIKEIEADYEINLNELNRMFQENDIRRRKREIPDYLCGKISFELMTDPVITPSGITYDRNDIEQHLQRVGHFDPVTRQELKIDQLIPNLAMKEVIENFVSENPWVEGAL